MSSDQSNNNNDTTTSTSGGGGGGGTPVRSIQDLMQRMAMGEEPQQGDGDELTRHGSLLFDYTCFVVIGL